MDCSKSGYNRYFTPISVVARYVRRPIAERPDIRSVFELAQTLEQESVLSLFLGTDEMGHPIAMPPDVSYADAASLPVAYGTAHRMLITHNTVKAGDTVLILGASGGVGTGCVMLAKQLGAEVIACAGSAEKMEALKALGADHVVNYRETDFSKWAIQTYGKPQRRTYEGGVDVVINFTGGDTWVPSLKCLKRGGTLLVCGATAGHDPKEDLRYIWSFELKVIGSNSFYDDNLAALMDMIQAGTFKPTIDRVLPLEEAAEGLRMIRDREVMGKIVVTP